MTNREKYINNISNEEIAKEILENIVDHCSYCVYDAENWHNDCRDKDCVDGIKQWLEEEVEPTADEMFEELGYETKGQKVYTILYTKDEPNKDTRFIRLHKNINGEWEYEKYYDETTSRNPNISLLITKAEHEAICKKLEELKEESV